MGKSHPGATTFLLTREYTSVAISTSGAISNTRSAEPSLTYVLGAWYFSSRATWYHCTIAYTSAFNFQPTGPVNTSTTVGYSAQGRASQSVHWTPVDRSG